MLKQKEEVMVMAIKGIGGEGGLWRQH